MTQLNESQLFALIQSVQISDPVLKDLLREFVKRQQVVYNELFEQVALPPPQVDVPEEIAIPDVLIFEYELLLQGIKFTWEQPGPNAIFYEIRYGGNTWEEGSRQLVTSTTSAVLAGRETGQTHRYWIKAQGLDGSQSENAKPLDVLIPAISIPIVSSTVIDNFVLLSWPPVESAFQINYYIITRDGEEIGRLYGTFLTYFEIVAGTYQYGVQAVDIFGNVSERGVKDVTISQPADYVLEAVESDEFWGERINIYRDGLKPSIFANVSITETWGEYCANGYDTMQDEINDNYPYWLQPTVSTGQYIATFDYGAVFNNIVITVDWNLRLIVPSVSLRCFISTSVDGITYSEEVETTSIFVVAIRFAKVRFEFTASDMTRSLLEMYNLRARLDVKLELDAGQVNALAADTFGTPVFFNKPFKDIRSITVSPESAIELSATYSFVDVPHPPGFEVFVFDIAGARVDALVSWKAQGVL